MYASLMNSQPSGDVSGKADLDRLELVFFMPLYLEADNKRDQFLVKKRMFYLVHSGVNCGIRSAQASKGA